MWMQRSENVTTAPGLWEMLINPGISWGFVASQRKRAWIQGARSEGDAGIYNNMSKSLNKRNAVDMPDCADGSRNPMKYPG